MSKIIENTKSIEKVKVDVETLRNIIERIQKTDTPAAKKTDGDQNKSYPTEESTILKESITDHNQGKKWMAKSGIKTNRIKVYLYSIYCNGESQQLDSMHELIDDNKCSNPEKTKCWQEGWNSVRLENQLGTTKYNILPENYDESKKSSALKFLMSINSHIGGNKQRLYWTSGKLGIIWQEDLQKFMFNEFENNKMIFENKICEAVKQDGDTNPNKRKCRGDTDKYESIIGEGFKFSTTGQPEKTFKYKLVLTDGSIDKTELEKQNFDGGILFYYGSRQLYNEIENPKGGSVLNRTNKTKKKYIQKKSKKNRKTKGVNKKSKKNINRKKKLLK
jgi:hypothetical protein